MDHRLNGKSKSIKLQQDEIEEKLDDPGYGNAFLNTTPMMQSMK